ncbi:hypothetical protein E4U16_006725 [Claviceps sp. LM84 group G4]|nr:hypothetical protein E4U16_006725 [Claviceps sp. LM84 group G4]
MDMWMQLAWRRAMAMVVVRRLKMAVMESRTEAQAIELDGGTVEGSRSRSSQSGPGIEIESPTRPKMRLGTPRERLDEPEACRIRVRGRTGACDVKLQARTKQDLLLNLYELRYRRHGWLNAEGGQDSALQPDT